MKVELIISTLERHSFYYIDTLIFFYENGGNVDHMYVLIEKS